MKKLLLLLALVSGATFAADATAVYNIFCKNLTFESERRNCMDIIRPYNYFDDTAVNTCRNFTFSSTRQECLGYIGGKRYEPFEIDTCINATFDNEKLACLKKYGKRTICLERGYLLNQLRESVNDIHSQRAGEAVRKLNLLINNLSTDCQ